MKSYVKMSLCTLAVLTITACGSSNKSNNTQDAVKSSATESTNKINTTNTTPNSTNSVTNTTSNTTNSNLENQSTPTQKPQKPSTKNLETDSNGIEWRNRTLTEDNIVGPYKTLKVVSNFLDDNTCIGYCVRGGEWIEAPLSAENDHIRIDFKELAQKDGQSYFGVHQGKFSDPTIQGYNNHSGTKVRKTDIDYLFVNQPNTTYGILFDGNTADLFYQGLYAGQPSPKNVIEFVVQDRNNNYLTELKGQATYTGQVLATTVLEKSGYGRELIPAQPFIDGTVTLTADFGGSQKFFATDSSVKGEIDSKTMGKISLNESAVHKLANAFAGKAFAGEFSGSYGGLFTGQKLDDAVGRIELKNENANAGELKEYHAVFGGVKQ